MGSSASGLGLDDSEAEETGIDCKAMEAFEFTRLYWSACLRAFPDSDVVVSGYFKDCLRGAQISLGDGLFRLFCFRHGPPSSAASARVGAQWCPCGWVGSFPPPRAALALLVLGTLRRTVSPSDP